MGELKPPGDDGDNEEDGESNKPEVPKINPEELNPDNPENYILPPELAGPSEPEPAGPSRPELAGPLPGPSRPEIAGPSRPEVDLNFYRGESGIAGPSGSEEIPMETEQDVVSEVETSKTEEAPKVSFKGFKMKEKPKLVEDWSNDNSREAFELNDEEKTRIPTMKPLPDEQEFGK